MRLFIAINFDEETKARLLEVQSRLKTAGRGNFSHPENIHLTLVFLGETAPERLGEIRTVMDSLRVPKLRLSFDRAGNFGDLWWLGLAQNKELLTLQRELFEGLKQAGFPLENRRFSPHITLARQFRPHGLLDKDWLLGESFSTGADRVSLMLSERIAGKLTYTEQYAVAAKQTKG